jgi:hypothetical protein
MNRTIVMATTQVAERSRDFYRKHPWCTIFCNVDPRYSGGSGAMVPLETALRVRADEIEEYLASLEGLFGAASRRKALRLGLGGVVEVVCETRKGWAVLDLITGEQGVRSFEEQRRREAN